MGSAVFGPTSTANASVWCTAAFAPCSCRSVPLSVLLTEACPQIAEHPTTINRFIINTSLPVQAVALFQHINGKQLDNWNYDNDCSESTSILSTIAGNMGSVPDPLPVFFVLFMVLSVGAEPVGVNILCLFVIRFLLLGILGAMIPQIVSPTARSGPWAPPPCLVFL